VVETVPEGEHHCASTEFVCLEPKSEEPLNFWGHLFSNKSFSENLDRIAIGSTNSHKRFSPKALLSQKIELPPEPERKLIARILDTLDTQIQKTEALIAKLEKVKEGLLHDLLTRGIDDSGRLRPSPEQAPELYKESPLGLIPREWDTATLADLSIENGKYGSGESAASYDANLPRYVRITDITSSGQLDPFSKASIAWGQAEPYMLQPGDLLFARSGATVGKTYLYDPGDGPCAHAGYVIKFRIEKSVASPKYVFLWTQGEDYWNWIGKTLRQGAQPNINASEYGEHLLKLPPAQEQYLISSMYATHVSKIRSERSVMEKAKELKAALMDDLLTGRVRVTPLLDKAQATTPA